MASTRVERLCGKTRFRSSEQAKRALRVIRDQSDRGRVPVRWYACAGCNGFHLTGQAVWGVEDLPQTA